MDDVINAELRVTSVQIKPNPYNPEKFGDVMQIKATGCWVSENDEVQALPASLHITVYPGMSIPPPVGDDIVVTVRRK